MNETKITKVKKYTESHFSFLKNVYFKHNFKYDLPEGNETFVDFISIANSNNRIAEGSSFYEIVENDILNGLFEIEENHLTLLYINNNQQHNGIGSFCIQKIVSLLKDNYNSLTVFASPYSVDFYLKNNFIKKDEAVRQINGMKYYLMELTY